MALTPPISTEAGPIEEIAMRKGIVLAIGILGWVTLAGGAQGKLRVVTTTTDLAAIAKAVGGDLVEVQSIAKGYQDPHYVEAKPSYMVGLRQADLLAYVGLQLERGWLPLLIEGARNPRVLVGTPGHLNMSSPIRPLQVLTGPVSRAMGDVHPEGNPHYWLDPRNGFPLAELMAKTLKELDPKVSGYFEENLKAFRGSLTRAIQAWERRMAPYRGTEVVTYHQTWEYLLEWLGWRIVGVVEDKPGVPPSPRHLAELIQTMRQRKVKLLLSDNFTDLKIPKLVGERGGARLVMLPVSVGGVEGIHRYEDLFEHILSKLEEALRP
jgi:zinc/manganese transport system substrate-binding protein